MIEGLAIIGGTAEEFAAKFAEASRISAETLAAWGRAPYYVDGCDLFEFPHWHMGHADDGELERRREIPPPTE